MHSSVIVGKNAMLFAITRVFLNTNNFRALARKLTYSLAASFQEYSKRVKAAELSMRSESGSEQKKKFAIDLRTPEEMQQEVEDQETEA